ncbi:MAG: saccharopine dehydrogenase [Rhodobacterales bacterium]|nr:MAG: saccharopine dehydrogenase [Rhodobacterales bacterium]
MTHFWLRHETRAHEDRSPLTPGGAKALIDAGFRVTVEDSPTRVFPTQDYAAAGCTVVQAGTWPDAPVETVILGLKELPETGTPLPHRHITFGHAFKGQHSGRALLDRFKAGGGTLLDLEYLTDANGRRVAAFGYWAGYAGAAVSLLALAAQTGAPMAPLTGWRDKAALLADLYAALRDHDTLSAIIIGALGRVGVGAADLCAEAGVSVTGWDMAETASGGPFPEILNHDLFFNCILARPGTPVFVGPEALCAPRKLRMIGDIACDPDSDYNPVPLYEEATSWEAPVVPVHDDPPLEVMAIDNLPSLLPRESTEDFAAQLLPHLLAFDSDEHGVWSRAREEFARHL